MNEFVCKLNFTEEEKEQLKQMGFSLSKNQNGRDLAYMRFEADYNYFELDFESEF